MDPISQGALGAALPQAALTGERLRAYGLLGCLAGMAPDLDVLIQSPSDPLLFLEYHRTVTHALVFIPVGAAIVALATWPWARRHVSARQAYLVCLLGYATHGLLDACTSYGTQLFWPFTDDRIAWNNVSVIDPAFTLPLVTLVALAAWWRRRVLAIAGMAWAVGYLGLGAIQYQRALAEGEALAASRDHTPTRLTAKPGFGNLLVWKLIYQHDGHFYVDAVRTGWQNHICVGERIPVLDVNRHAPWLAPATQQSNDIDRFRWFSQDYVGVHPERPLEVVDVRYSLVPNTIDPLWGIRLNRGAGPTEHVEYFTSRGGRARQTRGYWDMLTAGVCFQR